MTIIKNNDTDRKLSRYLTAWTKVFALGIDTLLVVDIVLPAVLGPTVDQYTHRNFTRTDHGILVLIGEAGIVAWRSYIAKISIHRKREVRIRPGTTGYTYQLHGN